MTGQINSQAMKVDKVAELLDVSTKTVYRLVATGELGCIHVGRAVRVTRGQLDAYLEKLGANDE